MTDFLERTKKYWLAAIILAQPVLDVIAYWTSSSSGTLAGVVRLAVMLLLFLYAACANIKNRRFLLAVAALVIAYGFHILNCFRIGYMDFTGDLRYMLQVAYMPVMAICFCCLVRDDRTRDLVIKCMVINAFVLAAVIGLSYVTGTYTGTYGPDRGISGWVIESNRCCHSDILSALCIFLAYFALSAINMVFSIISLVLVFVLLYTNGTAACYLTLFAIMAGYPVFIVFRSIVKKVNITKIQKILSAFMALLFALAVFLYPRSARFSEDVSMSGNLDNRQVLFEEYMEKHSYDLDSMTAGDILADDFCRESFEMYYGTFLYFQFPQNADKLNIDEFIAACGASTDASVIGETRYMKQIYSKIIFGKCDPLTKLTGFEYEKLGNNKSVDLENDYYAIFYYYGYLGFAAYMILFAYLLYRMFRVLSLNFKAYLTHLNFTLILAFAIMLGLAYFSGAVLRRPNASIYMSIIVALIYYQTKIDNSAKLHK